MKMRRCFTDPHYWKNPALRRSREKYWPEIIGEIGFYKVDDVTYLWPFFEGNQQSIKCIAAYIESFLCGKPSGYKLESQRGIKSSSRSKGMFLAQNTALSPITGI